MPIITLKFKDIKIRDYQLDTGQTCTIGRKHSNDIVIDNLTVSGSHARIESVATTFVLRDLESTNGTFINNEKITLHNLRHNDEIVIGNHKLVFDLSDMAKAASSIHDDYEVDKTRILTTSSLSHLTKNNPGKTTTVPVANDNQQSFFAKLLKKIFG